MMRFFHRESDHLEPSDGLWVVVGLGNPGKQYERTRHNVGFMAVDRLADRYGMTFKRSKQRADVARGTVSGVPVLLAKPVTFMNESGNAVVRVLSYYNVPPSRLLVVCDDIDLPFGTIRIRPEGSSGGQRGLQSVITSISTQDFPRLRIGVNRPPGGAISHVLQQFAGQEAERLPGILDITVDAVEEILTTGVQPAMNRFNRSWLESLT